MTRIRELSIDDTGAAGSLKSAPTWLDIVAAFEQLDGQRWTQIGLIVDDDHHLIVGGGPQGYVLAHQCGDEVRSLLGGALADGTSRWIVCGQCAEFPNDEVVDREHALAAARAFFDCADLTAGFRWRAY
jgi:hypothetical protein